MLTNRAKQRLESGKVALGVNCGMGAPFLAEVLARAGFDWVMVDNQHGMWDRQSSSLAMMGVRAGGSTPVVRAPENDYYAIGRLLDEGALGVIVPMVDNREEAERVVQACRYPPIGSRSDGVSGASVYGPSYRERANDEILVAIQLESREAIENADAIMSVEGIDACWLGPADLANSHWPRAQHARARRGGERDDRGLQAPREGRGNRRGQRGAGGEVGGGRLHLRQRRRRQDLCGNQRGGGVQRPGELAGVARYGTHRFIDQSRQGQAAPRRGGPGRRQSRSAARTLWSCSRGRDSTGC